MLTASGLFLLSLIGYSTSASNTRCFPLFEGGSLCFIQPDPLVALSWSSALDWCKNIEATLPITDTYYYEVMYENALDFFGLHTETLWMGANSTYDPNNWHWSNGTRFTGTIENRDLADKTQAYVVRNGADIKFIAASPFDSNRFICESSNSEIDCATSPNSYWTGAKCLQKNSWEYSSYSAWRICGRRGLALIDNLNELSRWIEDSQKFWIGLRCAWWTWQDIVTGTSREILANEFGSKFPNGSSGECLASYRDDVLDIEWMNLNCARHMQFVCQKYVNDTTTATTTTVTTLPPTENASPTSTNTKTSTPSIPTKPAASTSTAIPTPTAATTTTTTPASTTKTTASTSTSTATTSTSTPFKTPASNGGSATSSADITSHQTSNNKSSHTNNGLAIGLGVGVGLFLVVILLITLLTVYGHRKIRVMDDQLKALHRQTAGQKTTSSNAYDNMAFNRA